MLYQLFPVLLYQGSCNCPLVGAIFFFCRGLEDYSSGSMTSQQKLKNGDAWCIFLVFFDLLASIPFKQPILTERILKNSPPPPFSVSISLEQMSLPETFPCGKPLKFFWQPRNCQKPLQYFHLLLHLAVGWWVFQPQPHPPKRNGERNLKITPLEKGCSSSKLHQIWRKLPWKKKHIYKAPLILGVP